MRRYTFLTWGVLWRLLLLVSVLAIGVWVYVGGYKVVPKKEPEPEVLSGQDPTIADIPPVTSVMVEADNTSEIIECTDAVCDRLQVPAHAVDDLALYDGEGWYYYRGKEDEGVQLIRMQGEEETLLVDETDLTRPRDMYMSPNGTKVAYFLDNKHSDESLTELWMYDAASGGTQLLAENLVAPDILTKPRWNAQSTEVFFLADSGTDDTEQVELIGVQTSPPAVSAQFLQVNFSKLEDVIASGPFDVRSQAAALAVGQEVTDARPAQLEVIEKAGPVHTKSVVGDIVFVQWLEGGRLLYAVEHRKQISFVVFDGESHAPLARIDGSFVSARSDTGGRYLSLAIETSPGRVRSYTLDMRTGLTKDAGILPVQSSSVHVVHVSLRNAPDRSLSAAVQLTDTQIISFIDKHAKAIVGDSAYPVRIVTTDQSNTLYLDYVNQDNTTSRMLVLIQDAIHPEWDVLAHYTSAGGEWHKTEGVEHSDPAPKKLYEWEYTLEQWVLKEEFLPESSLS